MGGGKEREGRVETGEEEAGREWYVGCEYSPEQGFQVLWQLSSPGIPRVHGDEETHCGSESDLTTLEDEPIGEAIMEVSRTRKCSLASH